MEADVDIRAVEEKQSKSGNTRYVVRDSGGNEYTTFRPAIGREAAKFEGRRAHITWHEDDKNGFHNVYLDAIGPPADAGDEATGSGETDPDEVAWNTAVEAAPWLVGSGEPEPDSDDS